jgi:hypothetical protein
MAKKKQTRKASAKAKHVESTKKNNLPTGVKIVAVWYYIWAILWMVFGLLIAIGSSAIITYLIGLFPGLATVRFGTLILLGIVVGLVLIGLGVLEFFVARGMWRLKAWARITAILLSLLAVVNAVYVLTSGLQPIQLTRLIFDGGIVLYLVFSKDAKKLFK